MQRVSFLNHLTWVCAFATAKANASILLKIRICFVFDTNGWTMNEAGKYFILYFYLFFKGHVNVDAITHSSRSTYTHTNELGKKNAKSATTRLRPFDYLLAIEWILYIAIVCVTVWCASASARVNKHKRNCEFMMDEPTSTDSCTMCTFNARHRHHRVSSHCIRLSSSSLSFRCARQYHDLT